MGGEASLIEEFCGYSGPVYDSCLRRKHNFRAPRMGSVEFFHE